MAIYSAARVRLAGMVTVRPMFRGTVIVIISIWILGVVCPGEQHPRIMSWEEYSRRSYTWPYILDIRSGKGELLYFGVSHTYDPANPQIAQIVTLWKNLRPDIAFDEGGNPPVEKTSDEAVRKHGEPGLVRFLAASEKVPVESIDPARAAEVASLLKLFPAEQVKLFFLLRFVSQKRQRDGLRGIDQELKRVLPIFEATPGLSVPPRSVHQLEAAFRRYFPEQRDFRKAPASWFDPVASENFLNEISRSSNEYRDQYMVDLLTRQVRQGKRVFAVVGGTHVVMQERALRSALH